MNEAEYAAVRSLDTGSVVATAVGDSRIALAAVSGDVSLVAPEETDQLQFGVEGRPRSLALDPLCYVSLDDRVLAFRTDDGARAWETTLDGVTALCSLPEASLLVAATGDDFVGLDAGDGTERFRTDREHADVADSVVLAGRGDRFLAGASWYLTTFDAAGDLRHEADLDGAVTGLGLLEDLAVVALRGGRLSGVGVESGASQWSYDRHVDWLAPRGSDHLYAASEGRIVAVAPDGDVAPVGADSGGDADRLVAAIDGSLACRVRGRTTDVLRPRASVSAVDLDLRTASVPVGGDLAVSVENHGTPVRGEVRVSSDGAAVRPETRPVALDADERTSLSFTLADAGASTADVTVEFVGSDGDAVSDPAVRIEERLDVRASTPELAAETEFRAIERGTASVDVLVRTDDGSELPRVSIEPGGVTVEPAAGQSSLRRTIHVPLGTDRLLVAPEGGGHAPTRIDLSLPTDPLSIAVRGRDDGFVDVELDNRSGVPIEDEVRVTGEALPTPVERVASLAPEGRLTIALPATASGTQTIDVATETASASSTVTLDRAALAGGATEAAESTSPSSSPSTSPSSSPSTSPSSSPSSSPTAPGRPEPGDATAPADERSSAESPGTAGSGFESADPVSPEPSSSASDPASREATPTDSEADAGPPIDLSRDLGAESVPEGHAVEETLTLTNRSPESQTVTLSSGEATETVELDGSESARASRYHAAWEATSVDVPAVTAEAADHETTVPATSLGVDDADVLVRPTLFEQASTTDVRLAVQNNLDRPCAVIEVGSRGFDRSVPFDGFEVQPGATASQETTYQGTPAEDPALTFVRINQRPRPIQTVAPVYDSRSAPVSVAVEAVDVLGDRDTNVVLRLRNESESPLDLRVEATGDAPDEYLYSASEIEALPPGEDTTHRVECTGDADHIELPVEISATPAGESGDDAEPDEATITVAGDRTADAAEWEQERADAGDADASDDAPSTLSTPFDLQS
ncbi:MAG: hypothetical protein ABEK02_01950 [Haloquadratum sp.]